MKFRNKKRFRKLMGKQGLSAHISTEKKKIRGLKEPVNKNDVVR